MPIRSLEMNGRGEEIKPVIRKPDVGKMSGIFLPKRRDDMFFKTCHLFPKKPDKALRLWCFKNNIDSIAYCDYSGDLVE